MEKVSGVIEEVSLHKIYELFKSKPRGLKFNDTDAIVLSVKTEDGKKITSTFYFGLKPDGTFDDKTVSGNGSHARRQRLASFLKYYRITDNVRGYNIKEKIGEWKGRSLEVLRSEKGEKIYIP